MSRQSAVSRKDEALRAEAAVALVSLEYFFGKPYKHLPPLVFIIVNRGEAAAIVKEAKLNQPNVVVKAGRGFEISDGRLVEQKTKRPCAVLEINVEVPSADRAEVSMSWTGTALGFSISDYKLRKIAGVWSVVETLNGPTS